MFTYSKEQIEKKIKECFNIDMLDKYHNLDENPLLTFQYLLEFLEKSHHGEIRPRLLALIDSISEIKEEYLGEQFENLPSDIVSEFAYIISNCRF